MFLSLCALKHAGIMPATGLGVMTARQLQSGSDIKFILTGATDELPDRIFHPILSFLFMTKPLLRRMLFPEILQYCYQKSIVPIGQ